MADLKAEVAAQFELAPDTPVHGGFPGFGDINLAELTLDQAKSLHENGFHWLIPKKPKATKS